MSRADLLLLSATSTLQRNFFKYWVLCNMSLAALDAALQGTVFIGFARLKQISRAMTQCFPTSAILTTWFFYFNAAAMFRSKKRNSAQGEYVFLPLQTQFEHSIFLQGPKAFWNFQWSSGFQFMLHQTIFVKSATTRILVELRSSKWDSGKCTKRLFPS